MDGSKNLVLGFCARQPFRVLVPFIESLHRAGFAGDVCILTEDIAADVIEELRAHGIIVERTAPSAQPRMTSMASRFFSFLDYLVRRCGAYGRVLLVDPCDVVFQSDPFAGPLPADIVYSSERRRIEESTTERDAVAQAYGASVADNLRDCIASDANFTIGTIRGILGYLTAMTHELAGRTSPIGGAIDRGVHNYVVWMRPQRFGWLDTADQFAVAVRNLPDDAMSVGVDGVLVGGRKIPALSGWRDSARIQAYVQNTFHLNGRIRDSLPSQEHPPPPAHSLTPGGDCVLAFHHRERDREWLPMFVRSLRCVAPEAKLHCVGDFTARERLVLADARCTLHQIPAKRLDIAENAAHFYLSQVLDQLAADEAQRPAHVLMLDSTRAFFVRDPFETKTIGVSLFCERPGRISDSDYNRARLAYFVQPEAAHLPLPVVSSSVLRGPLPAVHDFYRALLTEMVGRAELMNVGKVVQGVFNKLCYYGKLRFPPVAYPNGAEVYFDFWESGLPLDTRHGVRIGGTVPSIVLGWHLETPLMLKLRMDLSLPKAEA